MQDFEGKVAVVTGAGGFLGAALARRFAAEGMSVVLADAHADRLAGIEAELRQAERPAIAVAADVSSGASMQALADRAVDAFGGVHVLCNNIGINTRDESLWTTTEADWNWAMGANLWSVIHATRVFVPLMLAQDTDCHIVNTASTAGLAGRAGTGSYVVTKSGVLALSEILYHELARIEAKVGVSVLIPHIRGAVTQTERPPAFRRPGDEEQLQRDRARFEERLAIATAHTDYKFPDEIAEDVLQAVRERRFYIITRPDIALRIAQGRADAMRDGRAPTTASMEQYREHEQHAAR
jgi:NAD(P)-dependent dehydrogenase (short-subunit alcohol dehydrogenase family)